MSTPLANASVFKDLEQIQIEADMANEAAKSLVDARKQHLADRVDQALADSRGIPELTVDELRFCLTDEGAPTKGRKAELQKRLAALQARAGWDASGRGRAHDAKVAETLAKAMTLKAALGRIAEADSLRRQMVTNADPSVGLFSSHHMESVYRAVVAQRVAEHCHRVACLIVMNDLDAAKAKEHVRSEVINGVRLSNTSGRGHLGFDDACTEGDLKFVQMVERSWM